MVRSPRLIKKPRKFTPTPSVAAAPDNYLLRFEDNGELLVVKRSSIGSIIEDRAIVGAGNKRRVAIIEAQGTFSQCNTMYEQAATDATGDENDEQDATNDMIDDEDILFNDNSESQAEIPPLTQKRKRSALAVDDVDECDNNIVASQDGLSKARKRCRLAQSTSNEDNEPVIKNFEKTRLFEPHVLYQTIDEMHSVIANRIDKKLENFFKKCDRYTQRSVDQTLDIYREKDENFPTTFLYLDKDLLTIRGRDMYDYSRQVLRILFTKEELNTSILPPARSYLSRPSLDEKRFNILHEAIRIKYKLSTLHYDECYSKLIKPRLSDFLVDERKRQAKELVRKQMVVNDSTSYYP